MKAAQSPAPQVTGAQYPAPVVTQAPAPTVPVTQQVTPAQLDLSSLLTQLVPIITLAMMFAILVPMMRQLGQAFQA